MEPMNRREMLSLVAKNAIGTGLVFSSGSLLASTPAPAGDHPLPPLARKPMLMQVGCQRGQITKDNLEFRARHGVFNVDGRSPKFIEGVGWDLDDSLAKREACEKYGIALDAYHLPLISGGIEKAPLPNIMLGKSPARDREIALLQQMIVVAAKTGVKVLNYNTTILPVLRTGKTIDPLRGFAAYSTWNYQEALKQNQPNTIAGVVSLDEMFERITYCLDRLLPVAEEYKVKLANHIVDPPTPVGYRGIMPWTSPEVFSGIKRFAALYDSPAHGFNLCLGSVAEGMKDPATEILAVVKWLGDRRQIFNIHMRNIRGGLDNFQEVYPDNGVMDFAAVMRLLRDVGYEGMVMPDHLPSHEDPASVPQGFAFAYGYIKALIQAVGSENTAV